MKQKTIQREEDAASVAFRFMRIVILAAALRGIPEDTLEAAVIDGAGPSGRFRRRIVLDEAGRRLLEDPPGSPWPEGDLTLRDAAAAFWAPQRCAAGVR